MLQDAGSLAVERRRQAVVPKVLQIVDRGCEWILGTLGAAIASLVILQVIFRYVFNNSLTWSEEVARMLFVWGTLLGSAIGLQRGSHITVDALGGVLPSVGRRWLGVCVHGGLLAFSIALLVQGYKLSEGVASQLMAATQVSVAWVDASIPITAGLMAIHSLRWIVALARNEVVESEERVEAV